MIQIHPRPVNEFLVSVGGLSKENLGLIVEKFITWHQRRKGMLVVDKRHYFDQLKALFSFGRPVQFTEAPEFLREYRERWKDMLSKAPFPVRTVQAKTLWYLHLCKSPSDLVGKVVGLYRNFPVPIIQGTAIKGMTRSYAEQYLLPEGEMFQDEFVELFGGQPEDKAPSVGNLTFFNAIPLSGDYLIVDARTNQHDGYYSGNEQRMAWNNVVPIFYFSIPSGVPYLFAIGSEDSKCLDRGEAILKRALRKGGLGAESHVGYGYFEIIEDGEELRGSAPIGILE